MTKAMDSKKKGVIKREPPVGLQPHLIKGEGWLPEQHLCSTNLALRANSAEGSLRSTGLDEAHYVIGTSLP